MAEKSMLCLCLIVLLMLQHNNFGIYVQASRVLPPIVMLRSPKPPNSGDYWEYSINEDKGSEQDAFRPTSPGHSPGVGHETPPENYP
ncbi:hypothetical protein RJT34_06203 [Clitoria ternatea]|uniref:Uncharacterized protein n=1 Tax=Clitoria ternatea TaxID=43366 RepID=A0AAN9K4L3_CLITE